MPVLNLGPLQVTPVNRTGLVPGLRMVVIVVLQLITGPFFHACLATLNARLAAPVAPCS